MHVFAAVVAVVAAAGALGAVAVAIEVAAAPVVLRACVALGLAAATVRSSVAARVELDRSIVPRSARAALMVRRRKHQTAAAEQPHERRSAPEK